MTKVPDGFPWATMEEFYAAVEIAAAEMKAIGISKGHLVLQADGTLRGKGHPDKWLNDCDKED